MSKAAAQDELIVKKGTLELLIMELHHTYRNLLTEVVAVSWDAQCGIECKINPDTRPAF